MIVHHELTFTLIIVKLFLVKDSGAFSSATAHGFTEIDRSKYEEGKTQFALMDSKSKLPQYGQCWKDAIIKIQKGCKELDDVMQSRLALAYLNCFLEVQGRPTYHCNSFDTIAECTNVMNDVDRGSFTTFFTYTQNICYFLESQAWHQETERTIDRLSVNSEEVANRLEETSELQSEMIKRQNTTLINQEIILDKAANLSDIISESKDNIHLMFEEFKKTTNEQRMLINDVFDKVAKLQLTVLGEFSGFYSIIYYTLSVVVSYLLTSTQRTSGARFWLFGIVTLGVVAETMLISSISKGQDIFGINMRTESLETLLKLGGNAVNSSLVSIVGYNWYWWEYIYSIQWMCRKICGVLALVVLAVNIYRYKDINVINNQLLNDIKQQVTELRCNSLGISGSLSDQSAVVGDHSDFLQASDTPLAVAADSTGYETDSAVSECSTFTDTSSSSKATDHTYHPLINERDSCSSIMTGTSSSLVTELEDLRRSTPIKEMSNRIRVWAQTGYYQHSTPVDGSGEADRDSSIADSVKRRRRSKSATPQPSTSSSPTRYYLRPRGKRICENPVTRSESPRTFARAIKRLEEIAIKNSMLGRKYTVKRSNISNASDSDLRQF